MRVIGKALFGSQNYSLNSPASDTDYKVFVVPEFIDLYQMRKGDKTSLPIGYNKEHETPIDFRNFDKHIRAANCNNIELLYSKDLQIWDGNFLPYFKLAREAYANHYVAYKWDSFFSCVKGLVLNGITRYDNSEQNRMKAIARGIWWINFLSYVAKHNFTITNSTWSAPEVYVFPRKVRFSDDYGKVLAKEDWPAIFAEVKMITDRELARQPYDKLRCQQYENELQICAQTVVADAIRKELK